MDAGADLQLILQLKLFIPLFNDSDNDLCAWSIFIGSSRAFDTVNFKIPLDKLNFRFDMRNPTPTILYLP